MKHFKSHFNFLNGFLCCFIECLSGKSAEKDHQANQDLLQLIANKELVQSLTNSVVELERLISSSNQDYGKQCLFF